MSDLDPTQEQFEKAAADDWELRCWRALGDKWAPLLSGNAAAEPLSPDQMDAEIERLAKAKVNVFASVAEKAALTGIKHWQVSLRGDEAAYLIWDGVVVAELVRRTASDWLLFSPWLMTINPQHLSADNAGAAKRRAAHLLGVKVEVKMPENCPNCDRADCADFIARRMGLPHAKTETWYGANRADCPDCAAEDVRRADCRAHTVDWRQRAIDAEKRAAEFADYLACTLRELGEDADESRFNLAPLCAARAAAYNARNIAGAKRTESHAPPAARPERYWGTADKDYYTDTTADDAIASTLELARAKAHDDDEAWLDGEITVEEMRPSQPTAKPYDVDCLLEHLIETWTDEHVWEDDTPPDVKDVPVDVREKVQAGLQAMADWFPASVLEPTGVSLTVNVRAWVTQHAPEWLTDAEAA